MFIATLKAIGKEFFTISVGLSIVPFLILFGVTITDLNNKKGSQATNTEISSATMCKEGDCNNQANMDDLIKKHG